MSFLGGIVSGITNAVSGVAKAVGSIVSGVVGAVGQVVSTALNFVMSPFLGLFGLGTPSMPDVSTPASLTGVLIQKQGSDSNVPVVYGYRKVAGTVVFAETGSDTNKYLWVAYAISEGAVEGLKELWIDNIQIPAENISKLNNGARVTVSGNSIDSTTGASSACKYNKLTQLQFWSGLHYSDPASTGVGTIVKNNIFAGSPNFTADMNFNGCATLFARYEWPTDTTNNPFGGGIPQVQVCMLGRMVAGLVAGNPENIDYGNFAGGYTERYSTNPAEIVLDYLRNPFYGKGLQNSDIDWASFKVAAAKCNTEVEYYTGVRGPILTMNYVVNTGSTLFNNTKDMLSNFRAYLPYSNGKYKLVIEDAGHPTDILSGVATIVATFDKDNIQGEITYTGIERASKYNSVKVNYTDPSNNWSTQTVSYPENITERYNYIVADGMRENTGEFTFAGISNPYIAKDFARLIFNKSRWQDTINLTVSSQGFELEPGDSIYIDSNILKFGTDVNEGAIPWRIVSAKLNNDYTFTLGCVRNPDFIYPHVRAGEIDYKIGLYVPKGATRYFPPEPLGVPVSVHPPSFAPRDTTATDSVVTVPAVTDPTSSTGGGVGSPTSTTNSTNNTNTTATPSVAPPVLTDVISITQATYSTINGATYATLSFNQPLNSQYKSTTLYYKRNSSAETVYTQKEVTDTPGAGQAISVQIGPLLVGYTYKVTSIVRYTTGESSTQTVDAFFTTSTSGTQTSLQNANLAKVSAGWSLPTTALSNQADATINTITATTALTAGHPTTPRSLSITFLQDVNQFGQNTFANSMTVLYRPSGAGNYWKSFTYNFDPSYVAGLTTPVFTLSDLGISSYPNPAVSQTYDFIFRFGYTDGKASKYQWRVMNALIEYNGIGYNFVSFGTPTTPGTVIPIGTEPVTSYVPDLLSAHPNSVSDPKTITIGLYSVTTLDNVGQVRFFFNPPSTSNMASWYGVRIYKRAVVSGSNPSYGTPDSIYPANNAGGVWSALISNVDYTKEYEYVIIPLVESSGMVEADNCWYGRGTVNKVQTAPQYPYDNNWFSSMNFKQMKTTDALATITSAFAVVDPLPSLIKFQRININQSSHEFTGWYYNLKVQVPALSSGFQELHIYRRSFAPNPNAGVIDPYFGVGRWERLVITTSTHALGSDNTFTINLRGALDWTEFDSYYPSSGHATLLSSSYPSESKKPAGVSRPHQFFLAVKVSGTVSAYGAMLPFIPETINASSIDSAQYGAPVKTSFASLNSYPSGFYRNISDYRASLASGAVYYGNVIQTPPSVSPVVI